MKRIILLTLAIFCLFKVFSNATDSLLYQLSQTRDTLKKINLLCSLSDYTADSTGNASIEYAEQAYRLAMKFSDSCALCKTYFALGTSHQGKTKYSEALEYYQKAYELSKICGNENTLQRSCNNLGMLNRLSGNEGKAMEWYKKSLELGRKYRDTLGIIFTLNNIGNIHNDNKQYDKAIEYYESSIDMIHASDGSYNNYLSKIYYNIATTHYSNGNAPEAVKIYKQAYEMIGDNSPLESALFLKSIAEILMDEGNYKTALLYLDKAGEYYKMIDRKDSERLYYFLRYQAELELGMHEAALRDLERYQQLQDSIDIADMHILLTDIQEKYDNDNLKHITEMQKETLKARKHTIMMTALLASLAITILLFSLSINRYRKKTNLRLQEKQKQIDDALAYGRFVKEKLMLTDINLLNNNNLQHFILDRPKDKVGGDFFLIRNHSSGLFIIVGDATGHGIPGSFISLSVLNLFHQELHSGRQLTPSVLLEKIIHQWKIQSNAREAYDESFTASVLCLKKEGCTLASYRQKSILLDEGRISIPDKIKQQEKNPSGITNDIHLDYKDKRWLILTSDGYYDQLGGEDSCRFRIKKMQDILSQEKERNKENLLNSLETALKKHQGDEEQTDDILVVGIGLMSVKH